MGQHLGQALANLSIQISVLDLQAQINPGIIFALPSSWLRFIRFCLQIGWHASVGARGLPGRMHSILGKLFRSFSAYSELAWSVSARTSLTGSVRMPSIGRRGGAGQARPEYMTNGDQQHPPDQKEAPWPEELDMIR